MMQSWKKNNIFPNWALIQNTQHFDESKYSVQEAIMRQYCVLSDSFSYRPWKLWISIYEIKAADDKYIKRIKLGFNNPGIQLFSYSLYNNAKLGKCQK